MPSPRWIHPSAPLVVASLLAMLAAAASLTAAAARADDLDWPRQFDTSSGSFVIYQPQPEDLEGDRLTGRAAFSLKKGEEARTFGVLWYTEEIEIDRDSSTVTARSFDVTKVRLPRITSDEAARYERLMEREASGWDLSGSLDDLRAGLAAAEKERASVAGLDNTPPKILFHERRAILVVFDGEPAFEPIEDSALERAVNTPFAVVFDPGKRTYYLNGANLWYRAKDPMGPWTTLANPPRSVRQVVPPDTSSTDQVEGTPPEVLTATEPTELIATDGPPRYAPLVEDELLYMSNTESDVVLDVATQDLYVLISGRWFRAPSTEGPWAFVRGDQLPESFKRVPLDSPKGNILASVAGTEQADDAVADAEIPQTSAIQRDDRSFEAVYDGDPQFEPIEGTDLEYAVNTDAEIIFADGLYYACDQGVWYIADDPDGPWSVSETRPLGVEDIPPSCPVYDVRFVYIYESTPEVVYVGYVPGYMGCYPYYGTVVYGTGYRYHAWRGRHRYYPHRFTWGFHARYNPWLSRWSFGFSYGTGFLRVGTRWRSDLTGARSRVRSKWFGPGGYRRPLVAHDLTLQRVRTTNRVRNRLPDGLPWNLYNRPENVTRVDLSAARQRSIARPIIRPTSVSDDVFAGKDGKVYRRDRTGTWQVRTGERWRPATFPVPPVVVSPTDRRERTIPRSTVPSTRSSPTNMSRQRGEPAVERPAPRRENRPDRQRDERSEQPPPTQERRSRPSVQVTPPQDRPAPPAEQPAPPRERPAPPPEQPAPPQEQRTPERPNPGDLEREYRARHRSEREDDSSKEKEKALQRIKEERRERGR